MMDFADKHLSGKTIERSFDQFLPEPTPAVLKSPFNVRDFGAVADGLTKDTRAFQRALDACAVSGGGEVIVPAGKYMIGSLQLGHRTTLRLEKDSILSGSPDPEDYPMIDIRWEGRLQPGRRALLHAAFVDDVNIVGPGLIEGNPRRGTESKSARCGRGGSHRLQTMCSGTVSPSHREEIGRRIPPSATMSRSKTSTFADVATASTSIPAEMFSSNTATSMRVTTPSA